MTDDVSLGYSQHARCVHAQASPEKDARRSQLDPPSFRADVLIKAATMATLGWHQHVANHCEPVDHAQVMSNVTPAVWSTSLELRA